ncbi:FG-GAP repeat domain-containing protein, partial [Spirosoma flavum]
MKEEGKRHKMAEPVAAIKVKMMVRFILVCFLLCTILTANAKSKPKFDYDGDGKSDIWFKDYKGSWYIDYARNGFHGWDVVALNRGDGTAVALPADYDGDGKDDLSVKDRSGTWYIDYSKNGYATGWEVVAKNRGDNTVVALPADYDGDG